MNPALKPFLREITFETVESAHKNNCTRVSTFMLGSSSHVTFRDKFDKGLKRHIARESRIAGAFVIVQRGVWTE